MKGAIETRQKLKNNNKQIKVVPVYAMKAYRGRRIVALLILNF
jgi:hypothetical protein